MSGSYDQWGMKTTSTFKVIGRHVLNLWRIIRSEHNFNIYTFENAAFQILRQRYGAIIEKIAHHAQHTSQDAVV